MSDLDRARFLLRTALSDWHKGGVPMVDIMAHVSEACRALEDCADEVARMEDDGGPAPEPRLFSETDE